MLPLAGEEPHSFNSTWKSNFLEQAHIFAQGLPVQAEKWLRAWQQSHGEVWPTIQIYNQWLHADFANASAIVSGGGFPIKCVRQTRVPRARDEGLVIDAQYQMRIFFTGEVPTRSNNWHDFFNFMSWCAFPKSKAALNMRHVQAFDDVTPFPWKITGGNRGPVQDMLTLFEEAGIICVCPDDSLWESIRRRDWLEVFVRRRSEVIQKVRFYVFGHALLDVSLLEHPTLHGTCLRVAIDPRDSSDEQELRNNTDQTLALNIAQSSQLFHSLHLSPIPINGIPGWCAENEDSDYYKNKLIFRGR